MHASVEQREQGADRGLMDEPASCLHLRGFVVESGPLRSWRVGLSVAVLHYMVG